MTVPCQHPRTGIVTSRPLGGIEDSYAATRVCDRSECIAEAMAWVTKTTYGKPAFHVRDEVSAP